MVLRWWYCAPELLPAVHGAPRLLLSLDDKDDAEAELLLVDPMVRQG